MNGNINVQDTQEARFLPGSKIHVQQQTSQQCSPWRVGRVRWHPSAPLPGPEAARGPPRAGQGLTREGGAQAGVDARGRGGAGRAAPAPAAAPPPGHQGRAYSETHSPARSQHSPNSQATTSREASTSDRRPRERRPGPGGGAAAPHAHPLPTRPAARGGRDTLLQAGAVSGACQGLVSETPTDTCA